MQMKDVKIGTRLGFAFGLVLLIAMISALLTLSKVADMQGKPIGRVTQWLDRTDEVADQEAVTAIVAAAGAGDFSQRLSTEGTLLSQIVPSIQKTSELVQEIAAASAEQRESVTQIGGAVAHVAAR